MAIHRSQKSCPLLVLVLAIAACSAGKGGGLNTTDSNSPFAVAAAALARCLTPRLNTFSIRPRRSLRTRPSRRAGSVRI
jgi:hypothetical protein